MKCIFCKENASDSKSVEHIVPESLGNNNNILSAGIVCDRCNNYFARKVEKPVLELPYFTNLRFRNAIESKKGKIPRGRFLLPKSSYEGEVVIDPKNFSSNFILDPKSFELVKSGAVSQLYIPYDTTVPKGNVYVSRFLAKIAVETMALMILEGDRKDQDFFADEPQLDPIRNYARFNQRNENWVYSVRKIYSETEKFYLESGESVDLVYECDFLFTELNELYFIISIKGIEFVINMAGSSVDGYNQWLEKNKGISPLYREGRHFGYELTPGFKKNTKSNK